MTNLSVWLLKRCNDFPQNGVKWYIYGVELVTSVLGTQLHQLARANDLTSSTGPLVPQFSLTKMESSVPPWGSSLADGGACRLAPPELQVGFGRWLPAWSSAQQRSSLSRDKYRGQPPNSKHPRHRTFGVDATRENGSKLTKLFCPG